MGHYKHSNTAAMGQRLSPVLPKSIVTPAPKTSVLHCLRVTCKSVGLVGTVDLDVTRYQYARVVGCQRRTSKFTRAQETEKSQPTCCPQTCLVKNPMADILGTSPMGLT